MASIEHAPSLNGTHTDDASADTLDDVENVATDVATEDAGAIDESATAEAIEIADVAEGAGEVDGVEAAASEPESTTEPDFLSELAVAMRGVAAQERERLSGRAAEDASSHIDDARSRGTTTADSLRQVADDDVAGVESWAEAEIERIRGEAAERIETRRSELEAELERHETVVEGE